MIDIYKLKLKKDRKTTVLKGWSFILYLRKDRNASSWVMNNTFEYILPFHVSLID